MKKKPIVHKELSLNKVAKKLTLLLCLIPYSLIGFAATIQVTAQIGDPGCDLVEAITTANSNTPTGGCKDW